MKAPTRQFKNLKVRSIRYKRSALFSIFKSIWLHFSHSLFEGLLKLFSTHRDRVQTAQTKRIAENSTARATLLVNQYLAECCIPLTDCPLTYWKNHQSKFLKIIARKYLGIPATSVLSESTFSTAGDTVTAKRDRLSPDKVNKIVFVNRNIESLGKPENDFLMNIWI